MHPHSLLHACTELLAQILAFAHPADATVARYLREHPQFGPRERALLRATVWNVLRKKRLWDALADSGPKTTPKPRRLAIVGFDGPHTALDPALSAAEKTWLAECRARLESDTCAPALRHNLPDWLATALQAHTDDFDALADSLLQTAPLDVRVNIRTTKRERVQAALAEAGIDSTPTPYSPWGLRIAGKPALGQLPAFARGDFEVQDEGAQLLALLTGAKRGALVVDFCAGAGGKTLALGAAMRGTGRLYAFDTSAHRLAQLTPRLARSGLANVYSTAIAHERDERILRLAGKADRVLVDAPCSGIGTLRRNPDVKWRQSPASVQALAQQQRTILEAAARLVKPGGRLIYATCSLLQAENQSIAQAFSAAHADFEPQNAALLLAQAKVAHADSLCDAHGAIQLWPHLHQTDGFFAAVWQRK